ncbi:hypothetical protein [Streptomyces europaeiscabiei]|uniref:hypothetical protein n=1 Tax=Streptomyces europaeiscabiei TaxID=146819 RepID=UPI0029B35C70|nr:hypothetical protein [Streptomyces europaeiscabiei]MDX2762745.1 hypothetical protein [Streptomyces europaeiscabiei]
MINADTVVSAVVGVVIGAGAIWATLRAANPKRSLLWVPNSNASLLHGENTASAVTVSAGGRVLTKPRLVEIAIKNAGRKDILAQDFATGDDSLAFDFRAPIVGVMSTKVEPAAAPIPVTRTAGNILYVHSGLIKTRQVVRFSVLVDGDEKKITCHRAHLIETPIKKASDNDALLPLWQRSGTWAGGCVLVFCGLPLLAILVFFYLFNYGYLAPKGFTLCSNDPPVYVKNLEVCNQIRQSIPEESVGRSTEKPNRAPDSVGQSSAP